MVNPHVGPEIRLIVDYAFPNPSEWSTIAQGSLTNLKLVLARRHYAYLHEAWELACPVSPRTRTLWCSGDDELRKAFETQA